jgi:glycosyltransferase involved in cell wall biosynthesis
MGDRIEFAGSVQGAELARLLNRHRILAVPSVWEEPFGVVALEGIACGLTPVVTDSGGLPDAAGRCSVVIPKSDPSALANAIRHLYADAGAWTALRGFADEHLSRHRPEVVAAAYLAVLESSIGVPRSRARRSLAA